MGMFRIWNDALMTGLTLGTLGLYSFTFKLVPRASFAIVRSFEPGFVGFLYDYLMRR